MQSDRVCRWGEHIGRQLQATRGEAGADPDGMCFLRYFEKNVDGKAKKKKKAKTDKNVGDIFETAHHCVHACVGMHGQQDISRGDFYQIDMELHTLSAVDVRYIMRL